MGERRRGEPTDHRCRDDIDPIVDTGTAHDLRPENRVVIRVDEQLQRHGLSARILGGVRSGMRVDGPMQTTCGDEALLAPTDHCNGQGEDSDDRGAESGQGRLGVAGNRVGGGPPMTVSQPRHGDGGRRGIDGVDLLDPVVHGEDGRVTSALLPVDGDAAGRARC